MTTVLYADATALAIDYLAAQYDLRGVDASIGSQVPNPRPASFVLARRLGGPRGTAVSDRPQIAIECWAPSDEAAHDLAQLTRALLHNWPSTGDVYRVDEFAGPAVLPDPTSNQPRYVFTVQVHVRGGGLTPARTLINQLVGSVDGLSGTIDDL